MLVLKCAKMMLSGILVCAGVANGSAATEACGCDDAINCLDYAGADEGEAALF
jgi:hypothetical protein